MVGWEDGHSVGCAMIGRPQGNAGQVLAVRELDPAELVQLAPGMRTPGLTYFPKKLRESHRRIARLIAAGLRQNEVAARSGYSLSRITILNACPAFQDLVATYREAIDKEFVSSVETFVELATGNMITAERMIADRLEEAEEEGESIPMKYLISISRDAADRFGYGKRSTQVNLNADFATLLDKAIARTAKVVEARQVSSRSIDEPPVEQGVIVGPPAPHVSET